MFQKLLHLFSDATWQIFLLFRSRLLKRMLPTLKQDLQLFVIYYTYCFGLTALRQSIRFQNVERVIANLHVVLENIRTYKTPLGEKGLTDEQIAFLTAVFITMAADKQQIEITSHRRAIVQDNVSLLNEVYR